MEASTTSILTQDLWKKNKPVPLLKEVVKLGYSCQKKFWNIYLRFLLNIEIF